MSVEQQEKGQDKGSDKGQGTDKGAEKSAGAFSGKTFGGYRVGELLGSGAASAVYVAEPAAGGDKLALRIFSADLSRDKNLSARLVAEVQKACAVSHPNLVPVREIGTADYKGKRHLFIAMARLDGESLKSRLAKRGEPLPVAQALHIASEVGAALQAIHRANGTHRQVNAGAVFLGRGEAGRDKVYLLDLGSALVPSDGAADKGPGQSQSQPAKSGKGGKIQDDIRALAQLVQEMLGGVGADAATGGQAVLPLRWKNAKVPARLDAVLRSAFGDTLGAPDRSSRFDSVATFVAALFGTGETQPTFMAWSEDGRTAPRPRSTTSGNLLWAAALAALLIGGIVAYWMHAQDTPQSATPDLAAAVAPPTQKPGPSSAPGQVPGQAPENKAAPAAPASAPDTSRRPGPGTWPHRTGVIPPLRDAAPAPPTPPVAPSASGAPGAPGATPPAVRAPAPAPAAGAGTGAQPATGAAPPAVRAPAPTPAGGAGAGPPSAPAAPKTQPAAKPPAPPQGPGATSPAPAPGPSGQKEVK